MIHDFVISEDGAAVTWRCNGEEVLIKSSARVYATPIKDLGRVVVIDMHPSAGSDNAKIVGCDGVEIVRIKNPLTKEGGICFEDVFYSGNELTLIVAFQDRQVACVIDEDGNITRVYETR